MKWITIIDRNEGIKNELPEEYKDAKVRFSFYYKYEFNYESEDFIVVANGYDGDTIYRAGLEFEDTIGNIFLETGWGSFTIMDKR